MGLLDFKFRTAELEASANPFALVVLAQLAAVATKRDPSARLDRKIALTRRLYRRGLSRDEVLSLYAFIGWAMTLPEPLEDDSHRAIQAIEEAEQMRYVTTAERIGMRKGSERGLESESALLQRLARRRFGDAVAERAAVLLAMIRAPETLEQLGEGLLDDADEEVWLTAVQDLEQSNMVVQMRIGKPRISLRPAPEFVAATQLRAHPLLGMRLDPTENLRAVAVVDVA